MGKTKFAVWTLSIFAGLALCLALFSGCEDSNITTATPDILTQQIRALPVNQSFRLNIPTYEGSNQAVHPDILMASGSKNQLEAASFVLAFTPYPNSNDHFENPSVLTSTDGVNFGGPALELNPLSERPTGGHNDDPDIIYNPASQRYFLYYLETCRPDSQNVILLTSSDLTNWDKRTVLHYTQSIFEQQRVFMLSPSVIRNEEGTWFMYYVNCRKYTIEYLTSSDGVHWDSAVVFYPAVSRMNFQPWHIDVFRGNDYYYALVNGTRRDPNLYLARSEDLIHWEFSGQPLLTPQNCGLSCDWIYRTSGLEIDGTLYLYYSYRYDNRKWGICLYKKPLGEIAF